MKVFCDHHHDDLFESLRILFEDRLHYDFYRPIGAEWYTEGYWDVYNHPDTVIQYLGLQIGEEFQKKEIEEHMPWANRDNDGGNDGIYIIPGRGHNKSHRAITLEKFKNTKFDIIISSMPSHFTRFEKLISQYQPQAKHIFQMGNAWQPPSDAKNVLNSTTVQVASHINHVRYHQEFDTTVFKPIKIDNPRIVLNMQHYMSDPNTFRTLQADLPKWSFKEHGAGNRDGPVEMDRLAETVKQAGFVYHIKYGGEGYGYNIHHAYSCGKPMIVRASLFKGMTAASLFIDGENCIDIDGKSMPQIYNMLESMANNYQYFSDKVYARFKSIVNFNQEFEDIKIFLSNLK